MDLNTIKGYGPGSISDLARNGGDPTDMTNADLKGYGPGSIPDLARNGGGVLGAVISGTPVLTAIEDAAYAGFTVSAQGGKTAYVFALVGTWPAGIAINSGTGAVTGTPTAAGSFAGLSVKVTDADSKVDQLPAFTLVVAAA